MKPGTRVTVNGDGYHTMINDFLFENMDAIDQGKMWLQQEDRNHRFIEINIWL